MPKQFPIYERLLTLYPRQFQQKYSEQLVQTMADMLEDRPAKSDQLILWLRTVLDLFITVVQQNVMKAGENIMNKAKLPRKRTIALMLVLLVAVIGIFHSPIQYNIFPRLFIKPFYGHSAEVTLLQQNRSLQDPMARLLGSIPSTHNVCTGQAYPSWHHPGFNCQSTMTGYTRLPTTKAGQAFVVANAQKLQTALHTQGYEAGSNGVTLISLIAGTYQGKDYSPDAYYEKDFGSYVCIFDTDIAYSNPHPSAINTTFYCNRALYPFGK